LDVGFELAFLDSIVTGFQQHILPLRMRLHGRFATPSRHVIALRNARRPGSAARETACVSINNQHMGVHG